VRIRPGHSAITPTPVPVSEADIVSVNASTHALVEAYVLPRRGKVASEAGDVDHRAVPPVIIPVSAAWVKDMTAVMFVSI
jgi:hypothetical protein